MDGFTHIPRLHSNQNEQTRVLVQISHMVGRIVVGSEGTVLSGIAVGSKSFISNQGWKAPWSVTESQKINLTFDNGPNSTSTYTLRFCRRIEEQDLALFILDESSPRFSCALPISCLDGEVSDTKGLESLVDVGYIQRNSESSSPKDGMVAQSREELTFSYLASELEAHVCLLTLYEESY